VRLGKVHAVGAMTCGVLVRPNNWITTVSIVNTGVNNWAMLCQCEDEQPQVYLIC